MQIDIYVHTKITSKDKLNKLEKIDINQPFDTNISMLIHSLINNVNSKNINLIFNWIIKNQTQKTFYEKSVCYEKLIKKINEIASENISKNIINECVFELF